MGKIKNWLISGDTHSDFTRFKSLDHNLYKLEETGIIILGDCGINWHLDERDDGLKEYISSFGYTFYCLRGNHEARPQTAPRIFKMFDAKVGNYIYVDPSYPTICFLIDGEDYYFNDYKALAIGGAYSVDKEYRLRRGLTWFEDEQLSKEEMAYIGRKWYHHKFDIVLTHTCPLDWQPIDLFISGIDQSKVDNSMEIWLNEFKDTITWHHFLWGHYHADRDYGDGRRMFYEDIINLEDLVNVRN